MATDPEQPAPPEARITPAFLARLRAGNEVAAWTDFLATHAGHLLKVIRRFAANEEDQSDCFVFLCEHLASNQCRRLKKFDPNGSAQFTTWLYSVTFNLCRDWRRTHHPRQRRFGSINALSAFDQDVFHLIHEQGVSACDALPRLQARHTGASAADLDAAIQRVGASLTPRQRALLQTRGPHLVSLDDSAGEQLEHTHAYERDSDNDPAEIASTEQQQQRLQQALHTLPAGDRLLLRLRYEKELTLAEVARIGGLQNAQAADRQLRRIVDTLKSGIVAVGAEKSATSPCDKADTSAILTGDGNT